jgi:hypothetical protein
LENNGSEPEVIRIGRLIDRYGIEAVTGEKTIRLRLQADIHLAENIVSCYRARVAAMESEDFAGWVAKNDKVINFLDAVRDDWKAWVNE